ncbi:TetR family transcriptional regulator [Gorillibacterium timonense]|uniref:TetR family transcriptional regulator n=1 Tax=Gorillibacterium timonense TaxID=1689269 RepID=UPI00071C5567|nr:TetR family transcriptional regulator [Gorillibacterium timonense]
MANKMMNIRMTQTKGSLINSFFDLVSKKDFDKITISDIAAGANVNRATFYAHFQDKFEMLDYIMGDSALAAIAKQTNGEAKFDLESMEQLVLAVCDFYQQPDMQCRSSYVGLIVPQLKDKMVHELKAYLMKGLDCRAFTNNMKHLYGSIFAQAIHEGAIQWVTGNTMESKEEIAKRVALLLVGGFQSSISD